MRPQALALIERMNSQIPMSEEYIKVFTELAYTAEENNIICVCTDTCHIQALCRFLQVVADIVQNNNGVVPSELRM